MKSMLNVYKLWLFYLHKHLICILSLRVAVASMQFPTPRTVQSLCNGQKNTGSINKNVI